MNRDPYDPSNYERRQDLLSDEESLRLRQEQIRFERIRRNSFFTWIINSIYFIVGLIEVLLILRFLLRFFGANTQNEFAQFIYNLSAPLMAPFSTLFVSSKAGGGANIFDVNILIAIIVYSLLGWLAVSLIRVLFARP